MKILYLSCHSVLEYDEVSLFTELGHEVFSMGAYTNPEAGDGRRPPIKGAKFYPELHSASLQCSKENLHPVIVDWADAIVLMHNPKLPGQEAEQAWLIGNWPLIKEKRVIWRSIGQSLPRIERELQFYKDRGMEIVRYSPLERNIPDYAGENAIIRFYKDETEYTGWTGEKERIINFTQSLKQRGDHCGYNVWRRVTKGFKRKVYGPGNEDLGKVWGGIVSFAKLKRLLQSNRAYFYHGTAPASYTLSLIEAMMTGIPVIAAGTSFSDHIYSQRTNEISMIIQNNKNGFVSNSVEELREGVQLMFDKPEEANRIGQAGRTTAIKLFGKEAIKRQWKKFLGK